MAAVIGTRTSCLRAWRLVPCNATTTSTSRLHTSSVTSSRNSMTTISQTFASPRRAFSHQSSSSTLCRRVCFSPTTTKPRFASTSASASTSPATSGVELLTWNRFFDLRKKRRYINLVASVTTAVGTVVIAGPLLAAQDVDTWGAQITGIDPVFVLGASTLAAGALGWLCGPTFGNLMFRGWAGRRGWNDLIAQKEKSFYARIKRYRADPSSSSPQNPIPDYYGEKISSVKDYRRWLKDQKAFNLKKDKNML